MQKHLSLCFTLLIAVLLVGCAVKDPNNPRFVVAEGKGIKVTRAQLDGEVERLVCSLLAKPRVALAMGKALFYRQLEEGVEAAYTDAQQTMACNMMDADALEGVQAFIEKRAPRFS